MLDVVVLNDDGSVAEIKQKDITHEDFMQWLQHIEANEGIVFDNKV